MIKNIKENNAERNKVQADIAGNGASRKIYHKYFSKSLEGNNVDNMNVVPPGSGDSCNNVYNNEIANQYERVKQKLKKTRQKLQNDLESLKFDEEMKNDMRSFTDDEQQSANTSQKSFQLPLHQSKQLDYSERSEQFHDQFMLNINPKEMSRSELIELVLGFQQLIKNLMGNNYAMKVLIKQFIQSAPQFKKFVNDEPSAHKHFIQSSSSTKSKRKSRRSKASANCFHGAVSVNKQLAYSNSEIENLKPQKNDNIMDKKQCNQQHTSKSDKNIHFINYVNNTLKIHFNKDEDKMLKYVITANDMTDLEAYAQRLVSDGLGKIVEKKIRINRKNNLQAFISLTKNGVGQDAVIFMPVGRFYALDGDLVKAFVFNPYISQDSNISISNTASNLDTLLENRIEEESSNNKEEEKQTNNVSDSIPTAATKSSEIVWYSKAFVIKIIQSNQNRQIVGAIDCSKTVYLSDSKVYYKFKPRDSRIPPLYIPQESCCSLISLQNKTKSKPCLYLAKITDTNYRGYCLGTLLQFIGEVDDLNCEVKAILMQNGMGDIVPNTDEFNEMFNEPYLEPIVESMENTRKDLRHLCTFTIDPPNALDLDDALSIEKLSEDRYEIGVHISDVSYYLQEGSELDKLVQQRSTSIYMISEIIHMLPRSLCYRCSLFPGEDKLTFSIFWVFNFDGNFLSPPRLTRCIINSSCQLTYKHAQKIIDDVDKSFKAKNFPQIHNKWKLSDIAWRIKILNKISQILRLRRINDGALIISKPKLTFDLDPITGEPIKYTIEERCDANALIEEYMILANKAVAQLMYKHYPKLSILRNHAAPNLLLMERLRDKLSNFDINLKIESSKSLNDSIQHLYREASNYKGMDTILNYYLVRALPRAMYCCSEGKDKADFHHYALSVDFYTHFTSPIRRYPDIMVHRILAALLNYSPEPQFKPGELKNIVQICNEHKMAAKNISGDCMNLYFNRYVMTKGELQVAAIVVEIQKDLVNVIIIDTGHVLSVDFSTQEEILVNTTNAPNSILLTSKNHKDVSVKLEIFSHVNIKLTVSDQNLVGKFHLMDNLINKSL